MKKTASVLCGILAAGMVFPAFAEDQESALQKAWNSLLPGAWGRVLKILLIIVIGFLLVKAGRALIRLIFKRYSRRHPEKHGHLTAAPDGEADIQAPSGRRTAESLTLSVYTYALYFAMLVTVLSIAGVDTSGVLTVAGVGGIALSLGSQTLVKDALSGLFLWIDGYVKVGDIISVNGVTGTVENVALRTTALRCTNGNLQVIPNGDIRTVTNLTRDFRCALVDITVAHGQDYRKAIAVLEEAMKKLDEDCPLIDEPPRVEGVIAADGRAATVRIDSRCRVADCWELERTIRLCALEALAENGFRV